MTPQLARLLVVVALALGGCAGAATTPSPLPPSSGPASNPPALIFPTAPADGPDALTAAFGAAGTETHLGPPFVADPFQAHGVVMCLAKEPVRLYVFGSVRERMEAAAKIDPTNPSNIGTSMVDWNGRPRFWARDRLVILYLGEDAATEALLVNALGQPFAAAQGRPPLSEDKSLRLSPAQPRPCARMPRRRHGTDVALGRLAQLVRALA